VAATSPTSLDGLTGTFTASAPLAASTFWAIQATNGISDLAGQALQYFTSYFTTK
jgi:hypothetical protein